MSRASRGFNLLELMIASGLSLAVLAAAMSAGAALQRTALAQQQLVFAQNTLRLAKETIGAEIERAGAGLGGARVNMGDSDNRHAIRVSTAASYADAAWGAPAGAYAGLISDGLDLLTADTSAVVTLSDCNAGGGFRSRNGINVCVGDATAMTLENRNVVFANPNLSVGCAHKVTGSHNAGGRVQLQIGPRGGANDPPSSEPCAEDRDDFWAQQGGMVMEMRSVGFRVNWGPSGDQPAFEYTRDSGAAPVEWQPLSRQVERIRIRLGVADLSNPAAPLVWFPSDLSDAPARPAVDQCTAACLALVPGGTDAVDPAAGDAAAAQSALLRRVRLVELNIIARSERRELSQVVPDGAGFAVDPETGYLRDGYRRRTLVVRTSPRNASFAGVIP